MSSSVGEIRVDVAAHRAFVGSRELQLTTREFELLRVLVRAGGKVASGEDILKEVWGEDPTGQSPDPPDARDLAASQAR